MANRIDLNCDMGEGFGVYSLGSDAEILRYVTSANIACGFHAGDPATMRQTVRLALDHKVAIGAHPGFQDLVGFGRRVIQVTPQEVYDLVLYQIGALAAFTRAEGAVLSHVKPHGALYNMAAKDAALAKAIAEGVRDFDPTCVLVALAGSELVRAGEAAGLKTASEAFADRTYQGDGSLTPRDRPDALIHDPAIAAEQVVRVVRDGSVLSEQGTEIPLRAETICIHGDSPGAVEMAKTIRERLEQVGIAVQGFR